MDIDDIILKNNPQFRQPAPGGAGERRLMSQVEIKPYGVGKKEETRVQVDRALYHKSCNGCKGRIQGGSTYVAILSCGDYVARLHFQCASQLNANLELFMEHIEKLDDNPPPVPAEKEDS